MAGNERYTENAFQAAETGIEAHHFDRCLRCHGRKSIFPGGHAAQRYDRYEATIRPRG